MNLAAPTVSPRTLADVIPTPTERTRRIALEIALVAGFAVLTALAAQVRFSLGFTPVPITGQTFAVLLAGTALGWQRGLASQALYWVAGIVMPFAWYADDTSGSSISAGWNIATGTTAGYLAGFVLAAALVGYLAERGQDRNVATSIPAMLAGTAVIYTCGVLWLAYKLNVPVANGDRNAIEMGLTPFLVGDAIKLTAAGLLTPLAWRAVQRSRG
ncbi:MAG TPA: biotin transporter BioY [Ilumatobacter sp.]|nr:biotin transporter BioY [Ilumatobacter sp.]